MKDFKVYIFIASIILAVYLIAQYNRPKPIDWTPTYLKTNKIPFGTYILYNQLHDIFPGADILTFREPVYNVTSEHNLNHATYLIICGQAKFTEYDTQKLLSFIKKGNDVFISAKAFGEYFYKKFKIETNAIYMNNVEDSIHFLNPQLNPNRIYPVNKEIRENYFNEIDTANAIVLTQNMAKHSTFVKYSFGKGALYLNCTPELFTNYRLLDTAGADYAAKALSYLKNSKTIIWDEYYTIGRGGNESPMRVFFKNPDLKCAYYIALVSLLIYVIYQSKRRQRIIPVIEPLQNSTLDFVNVVGQVYYEQRDNSNIAHKKASYFLEHLRTKYHLKTNVLDDDFVTTLSQKSGVDALLIRELINQVTLARSGTQVSDADLISLNKNIEQFYHQSR